MAILAMQGRWGDAGRTALAMAFAAILEHGQDARGTILVAVSPVRAQAPPGRQVVGMWVVIRKSALLSH
jgi:hypothetical protein